MIVYKDESIYIRYMNESDIDYFTDEFIKLNRKGKEVLKQYFTEQTSGRRSVLVAVYNECPAGYITLVCNAEAGPFANKGIPEIKDFIVLPQFRCMGIGNKLMDCIETIAREKSEYVTLGVGMYADYGSAQRMYVKRGYIPDGSGLWHGEKHLYPYEDCINDDDLNLYFEKKLSK